VLMRTRGVAWPACNSLRCDLSSPSPPGHQLGCPLTVKPFSLSCFHGPFTEGPLSPLRGHHNGVQRTFFLFFRNYLIFNFLMTHYSVKLFFGQVLSSKCVFQVPSMVTMGGDLQPGCLADRLLTGLGQPQINP